MDRGLPTLVGATANEVDQAGRPGWAEMIDQSMVRPVNVNTRINGHMKNVNTLAENAMASTRVRVGDICLYSELEC